MSFCAISYAKKVPFSSSLKRNIAGQFLACGAAGPRIAYSVERFKVSARRLVNSPFQKLNGESVQTFGATITGIV